MVHVIPKKTNIWSKIQSLAHFQNDFCFGWCHKGCHFLFQKVSDPTKWKDILNRTPTFHDPINSQWLKSTFVLPPLAECLVSLRKSYFWSERGGNVILCCFRISSNISYNQGKSFKDELSLQGKRSGCGTLMTALHKQTNNIISLNCPD